MPVVKIPCLQCKGRSPNTLALYQLTDSRSREARQMWVLPSSSQLRELDLLIDWMD